jgi:hypothetical protein
MECSVGNFITFENEIQFTYAINELKYSQFIT